MELQASTALLGHAGAPAPLIRLGGDADAAPELSYNLPDATCYSGSYFLELDFPASIFRAAVRRAPPSDREVASIKVDPSASKVLTHDWLRSSTGINSITKVDKLAQLLESYGITRKSEPADKALRGKTRNVYQTRLAIRKTLSGESKPFGYTPPSKARPRLVLIETYRLSTFRGAYGAGRVLSTFTLLPGERTKISIRTWKKTDTEVKRASSILDSFSSTSAIEFQETLEAEHSDKRQVSDAFEYDAHAQASAKFGVGSASVQSGVKSATCAAREQFAKTVESATTRHAQEASANRQVEVNTSFQTTTSTGEQTEIERTIENVNVSRTLNFVFRQMNQEFVTILHLIDIRVGFFNGFPEARREVPLGQLDDLLAEVVEREQIAGVRQAIVDQLTSIRDYQQTIHSDFVVSTEGFERGDGYLRVNPSKTQSFDERYTVRGLIMSAVSNVIRTDGVIAESLLGEATALDEYAQRLQELEIARRAAEIATAAAQTARLSTMVELLQNGQLEAAKVVAESLRPYAFAADEKP